MDAKHAALRYTLLIIGTLLLVIVGAALYAAWQTLKTVTEHVIETVGMVATIVLYGLAGAVVIAALLGVVLLFSVIQRYRQNTNRFKPDAQGNKDSLLIEGPNKQRIFITPEPGNFVQPMPTTYSPRIEFRSADQHLLGPGYDDNYMVDADEEEVPLYIPSFAEALEEGEIGPGQKDLLFCYELVMDEETGEIDLAPLRGKAEAGHTQFIGGGSESGKSTYVAQIVAQETAMKTLHYVIDPHLIHPEKSIAAKLRAFEPWFILPPAQSHDEVRRVLEHAKHLKEAFLSGAVPAQYQGYRIKFIVDEVAALMQYQRSDNKELRKLYLDLAGFMGSLGIEMAKFGYTGLYMSQYATKKQLGEIEFRDACMSKMILKLPAIQAYAMRELTKEQVEELVHFDKGHGFLILSNDPYPRRIAFGDVQPQDLDRFAALLPPSPLRRRVTSTGFQATPNKLEVPTSIHMPPPRQEVTGEVTQEVAAEVAFEVPAQVLRIDPDMTYDKYQLFIDMVIDQASQNEVLKRVFGVEDPRGNAYQTAMKKYRAILSYILKSLKRSLPPQYTETQVSAHGQQEG